MERLITFHDEIMKKKSLSLLLTSFASLGVIGAIGVTASVKKDTGKAFVASGNYRYSLQGVGGTEDITTIAHMGSVDEEKLLFATAFSDGVYQTVQEQMNASAPASVGYVINGTEYSGNKYYTGITTITGSGNKSYVAGDIFTGTEFTKMVVYEYAVGTATHFEVTCFIKVGTTTVASQEKVFDFPAVSKLATPVVALSENVASWTAVANATSYDVYVNNVFNSNIAVTSFTVPTTTLGDYSVQVVAKGPAQFEDSDKSTAVVFTATFANSPIILTNVASSTDVAYLTESGHLANAPATMTDAEKALKFIPEPGVDNGYRIMTTNGLYLTVATFLNSGNDAANYLVGTEYNALATTQIWQPRKIADSTAYTMVNYGLPHAGTGEAQVMDGYSSEHVNTYWDIPAYTLQWYVRTAVATFAEQPTFIASTAVDMTKPIVASFAGRNTVLQYNSTDDKMELGALKSSISDLSPYAWTFEAVGDGYYYIKLANGKYLQSYYTTDYFTREANLVAGDASFKYKPVSRGGIYFYLANEFCTNNVGWEIYLCKSLTNSLSFYSDLLCSGDQVLRFANL